LLFTIEKLSLFQASCKNVIFTGITNGANIIKIILLTAKETKKENQENIQVLFVLS